MKRPTMRKQPARPMTQVERIEEGLAIMAYIVLRHGPHYAPLFEWLERELEAARNGPEERARRVLEAYAKKKDRAPISAKPKGEQLR